MKGSKRLISKLLSGLLSIAMLVVPLAPISTASTAYAAETVNEGAVSIEDGAILHAFCWSFNTIKDNMANIAAAGYSAVQTSPINECAAKYPAMTLMGSNGKWYYHYQPTDWKIGNYQLGTRDQFIAMCKEADKYGIKIIVDVVPNHTAADTSLVSRNLINAVGGNLNTLYHSTGFTAIGDYSNRLQCTRYSMGGLPDVDTENTAFQNYFISFLNDCIACGADGFRYDTAKHIGLPDDATASGVNNNFWTRVTTEITNASNIFNYGEVLQGANERLTAYQNMLDATTASSYGSTIRNAIVNDKIGVTDIMYYQIDPAGNVDKLVTWVESHDNYLNDGTWSALNDTQIKQAWAIITAREAGSPLFFSRPYGSSTTNQYGTNTIGIAGSDIYKSAEVSAVNKFRNAMVGQSEYLRNPYDDARVLMIERGNKGVTIVNSSPYTYNLNGVTTNLADGTYYDHVSGSNMFTVSGGLITGTLGPESVVVLYNGGSTGNTTVHFYNSLNWNTVSAYIYGDSTAFGSWPGRAAVNEGNGWWKIDVPANASSNLHIIFNDGGNGSQSSDFIINNSAYVYTTGANDSIYSSKSAAEAALGIGSSGGSSSGNGIKMYTDTNYGGTTRTFDVGEYNLSNMTAAGIPNDSISSLKVPLGYKVIAYKDANFSGESKVYTSDTSWVGNQYNDWISSFKVEKAVYEIVSYHSGKSLDVDAWSTENGGNLIQWDRTNGTNQQWYLNDVGDGYYSIISVYNGKAIDVSDVSTADGANVHMWDYVGGTNQQWKINSLGNGLYSLINRNSNKALDVSDISVAAGANIHQWEYVGGANQQWYLYVK